MSILDIAVCIVLLFVTLSIFVSGMMDKSGINNDFYEWTALVIFPLNSALCPFLYTLTIIVKPKVNIMKTNVPMQYSIYRFFSAEKSESFNLKNINIYKFLLKALIVCTTSPRMVGLTSPCLHAWPLDHVTSVFHREMKNITKDTFI